MTREDIIAIYELGPDAVVELVTHLLEQIAQLSGRVMALEALLHKDSHNSHKPPSSDKDKDKNKDKNADKNKDVADDLADKEHSEQCGSSKKTRSLRQPTTRDSGGQPGHPGHTLQMSQCPDNLISHYPDRCQHCNCPLSDAPVVSTSRRQVYDIPPPKMEVTEHQCHTVECPCCGSLNSAGFDEGVNAPVQYGPYIQALVIYLINYHFLPLARTSQLLEDLLGQSINVSTLLCCQLKCYDRLQGVQEQIKAGIAQAKVAHFDETGFYGNGKREWLHNASTESLTYYEAHPSRGNKANDAIGILPEFSGIAVHDEYESYFSYGCQHSVCNAHRLRELTYIQEEFHQSWAATFKQLLCDIKQAVDTAKANGKKRLSQQSLQQFEKRYQEALDEGFRLNPTIEAEPGEIPHQRGPRKQTASKNLLDRLRDHRKETLLFMYDFDVPFDNNLAERDIRMMKVQQKISGCFRTQKGTSHFCRIRSYISTARKQGVNVLHALLDVFTGQPFIPAIPT